MHTLVLSRTANIHDEPETVDSFFDLRQYAKQYPIDGLSIHLVPVVCDDDGELTVITCELKVDALKLLRIENTSPESYREIKRICNLVLSHGGFTVDDFKVSRIDYCINVRVSDEDIRRCLFCVLQKCPTKALNTSRGGPYLTSLYSKNKSKAINVYDKMVERRARFKAVGSEAFVQGYERFMVRSEFQIKKEHIRYCEKRKGVPRTYDAWANSQRETKYLAKLKALIPAGDFFSLDAAKSKIDQSHFSNRIKERLKTFVQIIADANMDAAKKRYSYNTYRKYCEHLASINTNPLTIPDSFGIKHIPSPFLF